MLKKQYITKPIIKWVGGKGQMIERLMNEFPKEMNNYHEIFLGGGSVLLATLSNIRDKTITCNGKIYAYDINDSLIYLYKNIQDQPTELYKSLDKIRNDFMNVKETSVNRNPSCIDEATSSKESYYYWIRNEFNKLDKEQKRSILGSSMFIFLNKTCFRGIYRIGPNGFNVPYGHNKNPEIINYDHLMEVSGLIKNVVFETCNFENSTKRVDEGDFTYLDPPYAPETRTSFVSYVKEGFNVSQNTDLFNVCKEFEKRKVKMMMSNSHVDMVIENFPDDIFSVSRVSCKRLINSKNPKATAEEVIIKNY